MTYFQKICMYVALLYVLNIVSVGFRWSVELDQINVSVEQNINTAAQIKIFFIHVDRTPIEFYFDILLFLFYPKNILVIHSTFSIN